jgi:hypothetical protein
MQGGLNKKKTEKKAELPLRSLLGTPDIMSPITLQSTLAPKTQTDRNIQASIIGAPIDTTGMMTPNQKKIIKDVSTPPSQDIKPKDVKNISKQVTQAIVEKKAAEDPSWFERNKKGLRDAGIILSGALASFGEGIKGGNQTAAGERMMANLDAASKADEQAILDDPNSEESKRSQALFKQLFGNRVPMPENMTAAQFRQLSPVFERIDAKKLAQERANAPRAKELGKPILDSKQIERLDNAKRLRSTANELATELESSSGLGRLFGWSPETDRNRMADDITSYKAVLQGQGQAGEGQIKAGRESYASPATLESGKTKAAKVRAEGEKFYQDEVKKLLRQGFQAKTLNGREYLVNADTGEYIEM